ncbi:MAG TPA: MoaD/ThiS family protein [Candidatus Dormibacteraeota bacterium]|nr:MoaD/ThiS family protein [Candidatus Dormibacteraeota bacterium]
MTVSVLLFARYREAAGTPVIAVQIPPGATLADVWNQVRATVPQLRHESRPLLSCDRVYAAPDHPITGGEEVAAFPPVSGG